MHFSSWKRLHYLRCCPYDSLGRAVAAFSVGLISPHCSNTIPVLYQMPASYEVLHPDRWQQKLCLALLSTTSSNPLGGSFLASGSSLTHGLTHTLLNFQGGSPADLTFFLTEAFSSLASVLVNYGHLGLP